MNISNETKVGALTAITITLLILGFNFLKGKTLFKTGNIVFAVYTDSKGLMVSNPVYINGFNVGSVLDIENADKSLSAIVITLKLKENYNIPKNSVASIISNPLGAPSINIILGSSKEFLKTRDTLLTGTTPGMLGELKNTLGPLSDQVTETLESLQSVLKNINTIFDPTTKNNLQEVIANINKTTASLVVSSASIQSLMNEQTGAIVKSMQNTASFTKNLADNNEKITKVLSNVEKTTDNFSKSDITGAVEKLKSTITNLNSLLEKVGSQEGTLGKLMNDKALYYNLNNTVRSANILIDDLRVHPKRYVNVSIFGKKDKSVPLTAPLNDSTLKQQQ